jgi:hypothetical protein
MRFVMVIKSQKEQNGFDVVLVVVKMRGASQLVSHQSPMLLSEVSRDDFVKKRKKRTCDTTFFGPLGVVNDGGTWEYQQKST